ncbi:hypothetical protein ACIPPQ_20395 [Sphingopyxis sp. LARHCG72]
MSDPLPALLANMDRSEDRLARALWLANGNRADLWDNEHDDGWRLYMQQAKAEYRERTQRFLAAFSPAQEVDETERLRSAHEMLRWAREALDSGYRTTRAKQEIAKIDEYFAALSGDEGELS